METPTTYGITYKVKKELGGSVLEYRPVTVRTLEELFSVVKSIEETNTVVSILRKGSTD